MNHIIEVQNLKKSYGQVVAVKDISFYVEPGKLFAFLGPNGAGKSTTIDIICTFLKADGGTVTVDGYTLGKQDHDIRQTLGVVFQDSLLDPLLTVEENIRFRGGLYGLRDGALREAVKTAMTEVGVLEYSKRPYGKLSGGQRRRCDIARALVHRPKILFLDEPTTGLDPQTRKAVWEAIKELQRAHNMTVFLTTHYMEEAADADYVIIIDGGKISAKGTPPQLRETYTSDQLRMNCINPDIVQDILRKAGCIYSQQGALLVVNVAKTMDALPLVQQCAPHLHGFEVTAGTMDDAFIGILGKEPQE